MFCLTQEITCQRNVDWTCQVFWHYSVLLLVWEVCGCEKLEVGRRRYMEEKVRLCGFEEK